MSMHTSDPRLTPPSMSSGSSDRDPLKFAAQALLECLDRHDHHGRLDSAIERIIRICLAEILTNYQSQDTIWGDGSLEYGSTDLQPIAGVELQIPATFNEAARLSLTDFPPMVQSSALRSLYGQRQCQYDLLSRGCVEGVDLSFCLPHPGFLRGNSGSVTQESRAQPSHSFVPQGDTYSEGNTLSSSSTSHKQELHIRDAQDSREKVKCTLPGCPSIVRKANYTRHLNETHGRKVRPVCASCGRAFLRLYMKKKHERSCRG